MASWHVAASLEKLLAQLNAKAPHRSKISDGSIGDAAHAARNSDHNPWYQNTVTARDFTHDPDGGLNGQWLADALVASRDPRLKYVIWNRRIWLAGGRWKSYTGTNPHTHHVHVSVVASPMCERTTPWNLGDGVPQDAPVVPPWYALPVLKRGSTGDSVRHLQTFLRTTFPRYAGGLPTTGNFLDQTHAVVVEFQTRSHLEGDGIVGRDTNGALWAVGYRG